MAGTVGRLALTFEGYGFSRFRKANAVRVMSWRATHSDCRAFSCAGPPGSLKTYAVLLRISCAAPGLANTIVVVVEFG